MAPMPSVDLLSVLARHGVPFVVVGGHAVNFHGHIRTTEDTDVLWIRSRESEDALLRALNEVDARWFTDSKDPDTGLERLAPVSGPYIRANHLMMLVTDLGLLDLFDYVPGHPDANPGEVYATALVDDDGIRYVSFEWLVRMKQAAARPKDLDDLRKLRPPEGER